MYTFDVEIPMSLIFDITPKNYYIGNGVTSTTTEYNRCNSRSYHVPLCRVHFDSCRYQIRNLQTLS